MQSVDFEGSNRTLGKPEGMTEEQCRALPIRDIEQIIINPETNESTKIPFVVSCWCLTLVEIEELVRTGVLWVGINGYTQPPIFITTVKPF